MSIGRGPASSVAGTIAGAPAADERFRLTQKLLGLVAFPLPVAEYPVTRKVMNLFRQS